MVNVIAAIVPENSVVLEIYEITDKNEGIIRPVFTGVLKNRLNGNR